MSVWCHCSCENKGAAMCIGFPPPSLQQQRLFVDFHHSTAFGDQIGEVHNSWTRVGQVKHGSSQPTLLAVANSDTSMWITPTTSQCTHRYQEIGDFHCPCNVELNLSSQTWSLLSEFCCMHAQLHSVPVRLLKVNCHTLSRDLLVAVKGDFGGWVKILIIADEVRLTLLTSSSWTSSSSED